MAREQSKSAKRRFNDGKFHTTYFVGRGLDVGAGPDPLSQYMHVFRGMTKVDNWDQQQGDAQYLSWLKDNMYDFVHSSHCLEHLVDPYESLKNWIRVTKQNGHIVFTVPDVYLYEHGMWPSRYNEDHKWSFSIHRTRHQVPNNISIMEMLLTFDNIDVKRIELVDDFFNFSNQEDQTRSVTTECSIEVVLQKL